MIAEIPPDQSFDWPAPEVLIERAQLCAARHAYMRGHERDTWAGVDDASLRRVVRRLLALRWAYREGRVTS